MKIKRFNDFILENTQTGLGVLVNKKDSTKKVVNSILSDSKKMSEELTEYIIEMIQKLIDKDIFTKDNYNKTFEEMGGDHADTRKERKTSNTEEDKVMNDTRPSIYVYTESHGLGNIFKLMRYDLLKWLKSKKYGLMPIFALECNVYRSDFTGELDGKIVINDTKIFSQLVRDKIKKWLTASGDKISITENIKKDLLDIFNLNEDNKTEKFIMINEKSYKMLKENYESLNKPEDNPKEETLIQTLKTKAQSFFKSVGILEEE